jgi:GlpG protein
MRWIGSVSCLEDARRLVRYLANQGIESAAEKSPDEETRIWVVKEDQVAQAEQILQAFKQAPRDPKYDSPEPPRPLEALEERASEAEPIQSKVPLGMLTLLITILCCGLLSLQKIQEFQFFRAHPSAVVMGGILVPIEEELLIQVPPGQLALREWAIQRPAGAPSPTREEVETVLAGVPAYRGLWGEFQQDLGVFPQQPKGPILPEVRGGQVWRLWTPSFLHAGIIHLVFNLFWWVYLGRQIEYRLGWIRYLILILIGSLSSNLAQYFASGADFLGLSGVVCAQAGFVLSRERTAPWEGYPVPRATLNFLMGFVILAAVAEGMIVLAQAAGTVIQLPFGLGNSAHIAGGLAGILVGLLPWMRRRSVL